MQNKYEEIALYKEIRKSITALQKRRQQQSTAASATVAKNCCSSPSFNTHNSDVERELWDILESAQRLDVTNTHIVDFDDVMRSTNDDAVDALVRSAGRVSTYKLGLRKGERYYDPLAKRSLSRILRLHK